MLIDIIVSVILVLIIGGAIAYIARSKKRGETCVGCPYAKECAQKRSNHSCSCGCGGGSSSQSSCSRRSSADRASPDEP